jgi:small-conductance mechanosensitive channel
MEPADQPLSMLVAAAATPELREEFRTDESLEAVRSSATKWQTTLTTILGLLGLGSILGRDDVQALSSGDREVVIVALVVAVSSAVLALVFMTKASAGLPRLIFKSTAAQRMNVQDQAKKTSGEKAADAAVNIFVSLVFTAVSIAASLVSVGYLWAAPDATKPSSVKLTVNVDGVTSSYCGAVTEGSAGGLTLTPGANTSTASTFTPSQIRSITPC